MARNDAEQDASAVGALGAFGEEHVETELGDVLELALGGRIVDGDLNMANVAHFLCELVTNARKGKLPVIVNASKAT